jgi:hypothetical protein
MLDLYHRRRVILKSPVPQSTGPSHESREHIHPGERADGEAPSVTNAAKSLMKVSICISRVAIMFL